MQVTEVSAEGLKRAYKVVVPAEEIESRVTTRLRNLAQRVRVPGFRPGKAPLHLLRAQYGKSVMGEVVEEAVNEGTTKALGDNQIKPALRPKIEITSFEEGKALEFAMDVEVLPEVPQADLAAIELTRLKAEPDEARVATSLEGLAKARQKFEAPAEPRPSQKGDRVEIDFEGKIGGEPFSGGKAQDFPLTLGEGGMIADFEEQIEGMTEGEARQIAVTFPEDFPNEELRGKDATFDVTMKKIEAPVPVTMDDAFAKELGLEDKAALEKSMRERLENEYRSVARSKMKRQLLDILADTYRFDVPPGMVEMEFNAIWQQLQSEMQRTGQTFEQLGEDEEKSREEYRAIAERRVRLGLLLSDIGTKNEIRVEGQELQQALMREAMRFPGQEKKVFEFYQNTPGAIEQLRAPIFEDKVVDFIFQLAKVEEKPVSVDELLKEDEEEPATDKGEAADATSSA
jgi:trigger factor